ncbi:MAG: c-type cytochrome [Acidobacteriia bacterium]|nr:c-type cytochrome [Terriglobia bacterium]
MRALCLLFAISASLCAQPGPRARQPIDPAAAARGKKTYLQYCINCHGSLAQGTEQGPDLVRSVVVLRDKLGSALGPALQKLPNHKTDLTQAQIVDLSHFLRDRVEYTAMNRHASRPPNVLTGNAAAGKEYFSAKCNECHSPTGDLAGIAGKFQPDELQQRLLFPRRKPIAVTVRALGAPPVSGTLERIDDFTVSLRDAGGEFHSWKRVAGVEVEIKDPLSRHHELLDEFTDADIHNLVAYLETLK